MIRTIYIIFVLLLSYVNVFTQQDEAIEIIKAMDAKAKGNSSTQATVDTFEEGINESNVDAFLENVDIYVDSLDFFALAPRKLVFQKCQEKNIPVVTAAPIGMGTAFLYFKPGEMTYEEYFRFESAQSEEEQFIKFLIGLSPAMLHGKYLVVPEAANFDERKGPSTPMGVKFCAGMAGSYVLKILLGRGEVLCAPRGLHFDGYRNKFKITYRPWGNNNPIQKLAFHIAKKQLLNKKTPS